MEESEETMGLGADIKTEGPDAASCLYTFGVADVTVSVVCMTYTEIGIHGVQLLHIVQSIAAEHTDSSHMGHAGNGPKLTVHIPVHGDRAVLVNTYLLQKRTFFAVINFDSEIHRDPSFTKPV
jgi:hypothetical protein